jgi:cytoskeleton protein RodZ
MTQESDAKKDQLSAGAVLRAARESAGLSIEQVAEKLHLLHSVVNALEKDTYDRIRGETFVRGYMRNYARLLGINDQDVLRRYKSGQPMGTNVESEAVVRKRDTVSRDSSGAGRVGVVLALLALSAVFFHFNRDRADSRPPPVDPIVTVETGKGSFVLPTADDMNATPTVLSQR